MEKTLCRVVESFCSPTHNVVPHISWHDLPCHRTTKKYADIQIMVFFCCSCGNSGLKHGSIIVNIIFAYFTLSLSIACDLRAPHRRCTRMRSPFPPEADSLWSHISRGPSASRNTCSVSTITDGNARTEGPSTFLPSRWPDCTLSRLREEQYDRPVTLSMATPEPSSRTIATLDGTLVARWSLECVTTPGSRRSCPG